MNKLNLILENQLCTNLLSALLHSLWQGLVIAGLLLFFLKSKKTQNANSRYTASLIALASVVICLFFTWSILNYEPVPSSDNPVVTEFYGQVDSSTIQQENNLSTTEYVETENISAESTSTGFNWKPPVFALWFTGVIIMLFRAIYIMVGGTKLQLQCKTLEDENILEIVEQLRKKLRIIRTIRVAASEHITVPGVIGFFRPVLLLPISMISGVPTEALQAIFAHELAHIRRYDYLVNFCQMVIEAILFFNPAVWWISRQIRIEREVCCDNAGIATIGQRIRYAEVLIGWAQKMKEQNIEFAAAVVGFGKKDDSGSMLERIQRIVSNEHRPRLKVSWHIAAITMILSFVTLAGLWQGTNMTVAFAGKLLTPQERIDAISEIEKSHFVIEDREYTDADQITISGTIKTIDNEPLSDKSYIRVRYERPHYSGTSGIQISSQSDWSFKTNGDFSIKSEYGIIWLQINSDGYAPAFAGPLKTEPGGQINNLEFVLDKGFRAQIKIINESNEPIEGVSLVGGYQHTSGSLNYDINLTTDNGGLAMLENASYKNVTIKTTAEGYETENFKDIKLNPDSPVVLELKNANVTSGILLSKVTGKPVPDAVIRLLRSGTHSYGAENAPILTTTDDNGKFTLNTLRSDTRYMLAVDSPDHAYKLLYNITTGQKNLEVYLSEKFNIKGQIIGPLEKLKMKDGKYVINYTLGVVYDDFGSWETSKYAQVEVRDGKGYFEITEIMGNRVNIGNSGYRKSLNVEDEPVQEVVIDLTEIVADTGEEYKKRQVIIKFGYPEDYPAPEGIFKFRYIDRNFSINTYKNQDVPISNGQGTIDIPTPGKIAYDNEGITGYWFDEESEIKVPYEEEPFVLTISAVPAGVIYGEVFNPDGTKANNVLVSVVAVEKSHLMGDSPFIDVDGKNSAGPAEQDAKYVISPLPLQGKYVVIARRDFSYILSDPIELNDKTPILQLDMRLLQGISFNIKVMDENGKPVSAVPFEFHYSTPWSHGFSHGTKFTNIDGELLITNLNPDVPGNYSILVNNVQGYRPIRKNIESFDKPLEIQLEKGHVVTGKVIDDKTGWPIPRVEVYALPTNFNIPEPTTYLDAEAETDKNGKFMFTNMAQHEYELHTRGGQKYESGKLIYGSYPVTVIGGQEEEVVIRMILSESSSLKPRKPD